MPEHPSVKSGPSMMQLMELTKLCSKDEWERLLNSAGFITATMTSLKATEDFMSLHLNRKISLSAPSLANSGDEKL